MGVGAAEAVQLSRAEGRLVELDSPPPPPDRQLSLDTRAHPPALSHEMPPPGPTDSRLRRGSRCSTPSRCGTSACSLPLALPLSSLSRSCASSCKRLSALRRRVGGQQAGDGTRQPPPPPLHRPVAPPRHPPQYPPIPDPPT